MLWDVFGKNRAKVKPRLSDEDLQAAWNTLSQADAEKAHNAALELSQHPAQAIAFMQARIAANADKQKREVQPLIADLDSSQYRVRVQAEKKLRDLGALAIGELESAAHRPKSLEFIRRVEFLLQDIGSTPAMGTWLQTYRGLELLERLAAAAPLDGLGKDDGPVAIEARSCSKRLKDRSSR
jgi:hypothetical protein